MAEQIAKHATTPMFFSARPPTVYERWSSAGCDGEPSRAYRARLRNLHLQADLEHMGMGGADGHD
jgi:hypothetical protein